MSNRITNLLKKITTKVIGITHDPCLESNDTWGGEEHKSPHDAERGKSSGRNAILAQLREKDAFIESQALQFAQVDGDRKKLIKENESLKGTNQALATRLSDYEWKIKELEEKAERAERLENSARDLLDWIQSVIGYADNMKLFRSDADELEQFRADAKRLPALLRSNGIECDRTPPSEGIGFVRIQDERAGEGDEIISAPMLLRNGIIVADGIVLIPQIKEDPAPERTSVGECSSRLDGPMSSGAEAGVYSSSVNSIRDCAGRAEGEPSGQSGGNEEIDEYAKGASSKAWLFDM